MEQYSRVPDVAKKSIEIEAAGELQFRKIKERKEVDIS